MDTVKQSVGIFTTDKELIIRSWDDWLAQATGLSAKTAGGQALAALFPSLVERGLMARFEKVLTTGSVEILAPSFHRYLIPCPPRLPAQYFERMQQYVTLAPLREDEQIVGIIVTIEDVTPRLERRRALAEQLDSPDEHERLQAAELLAAEESAETTQTLATALGDESWRVRRVAVNSLAQHGSPAAASSLLRALRQEHQNPSVLNSALQVLNLINIDVLPPLLEFMQDPDVDLRIYAALALGEQNDARAIPALLAALSDPDLNVRYHAIEALGKLRADEAANPLLQIALSGDFFLAFPALDALTQIDQPHLAPSLVPLLTDELLSLPAIEALAQLGDAEVVPPLAALLAEPEAPVTTVVQALVTLYERYEKLYGEGAHIADLTRQAISDAGARALLAALPQAGAEALTALAMVLGWLKGQLVEEALTQLLSEPAARPEVVRALVRHGPRVVERLVERLETGDPDTRQAAVVALGRIGDTRSVEALIEALTGQPELTIVAAGALAKLGDRRAFEALLGLLGHPNAAVRQAVIGALNSLGHPDMPRRLIPLLGSANPHERESAVKIAGYFGFEQCKALLFERCHDPNEQVRRAAVEHLPYLDDPQVLPALAQALSDDRPRVRAAAAQALGQVEGADSLPHLLNALRDADPWVRYFAAKATGRRRYSGALDSLSRLLEADEAPHVRLAAVEALGQIGGERAAVILAPLVQATDVELAQAALTALGSIRHPAALPPLLAALRLPQAKLRLAALHGLSRDGSAEMIEPLRGVIATDSDQNIAQAAIAALSRLDKPEAVTTLVGLTAKSAHRPAIVSALAKLDVTRVAWLARGLNHADAEVRRAVVEALARMRQPQASEYLLAALEDPAAAVRLAAVAAFKELGNLQAKRKLANLARTDSDSLVRRAAGQAVKL